MDFGLEGKVAVVTGAASGIGQATAELLAGMGVRVVAGDADAERGQAAADRMREQGGEALFVAADVTDVAAVGALIGRAIEAYGRLDVAANCAGVGGGHARMHEYPEEHWDRIVEVNLKGTWSYAAAGIRINAVCPGAIDTPMMDDTFARFPGFREALVGFVPMGRMGLPAEVAGAIAWLASDAASFVTGEAVAIEGGLLGR
jgi:NAD(P)-dependent dehydrogenase (short-subunit alcohol dehydrogenase family)